jgi:hypothetical protein
MWTTEYIRQILNIIHICMSEGYTALMHDQIMYEIGDILMITPDELLPQHQYLLQLDFTKLGAGMTKDRQY